VIVVPIGTTSEAESQYRHPVADAVHRDFARRVRDAMKRKGWSRNQAADFIGIGRGHLSEILNGNKSPTLRTMRKIADALEVDLRDLVPSTR
jgi:transcriptional regulator with XRE-family HTH domain